MIRDQDVTQQVLGTSSLDKNFLMRLYPSQASLLKDVFPGLSKWDPHGGREPIQQAGLIQESLVPGLGD